MRPVLRRLRFTARGGGQDPVAPAVVVARPCPPRWSPLTVELRHRDGPVRTLLADAMPRLRDVQDDYRQAVGPILVPRRTSAPWTMGAAFDLWLQLQCQPRPDLRRVEQGARRAGRPVAAACEGLLDLLAPGEQPGPGSFPGPWTGPSRSVSPEELLRLCWAAAVLLEVYRTGVVAPGSPLLAPPRGAAGLLALAGQDDVDELGALTAVAATQLVPRLQELAGAGPTCPGPVFTGSRLMPADADLLAGRVLVEIKAVTGRPTAAGRRVSLDGRAVQQLLGYVLHDYDDAHGITGVALYQARYGHLTVWDLQALLEQLAGGTADLAELRSRWRDLLAAGRTPGPAARSSQPRRPLPRDAAARPAT